MKQKNLSDRMRAFRRLAAVLLVIGLGYSVAVGQNKSQLPSDPVVCCSQAKAFLGAVPGFNSESPGAVRLEPGRKQLFIDQAAVQSADNVVWKLHQPKKFGTVLRPDKPWDGNAIQIRSAPVWSREEKVWKIWYIPCNAGDPVRYVAVALSQDGVHWTKPSLGLVDYKGSRENNIMAVDPAVTGSDRIVINLIYDPDDPDPGRRYKALAGVSGRLPIVSSNGVDWKLLDVPRIPSDDESSLYYDREHKLFIATLKKPGPYGRSVYMSLSRDFEHWTDPRDCLIFHADRRDQDLGIQRMQARFANPAYQTPEHNTPEKYDVEVYNMGLVRYEGIYLGFPALFHQTGQVPKDWPGFAKFNLSPAVLEAVHHSGDWTGFHLLELLSSRDLIHWEHAGQREPFLYNSPLASGAYDLQVILPSSGPFKRDNELWFYYTGIRRYAYVSSDQPDIGGICLAKLRLDGFVSATASEAPGRIITKPFILGGESLHLNAAAPGGEVRVEVLDSTTQQVVPGYSLDDCLPVTGDGVDMEVKWKSAAFSALAGKKVSLRFSLRNADLYAYWVK